MVSYRLLRFRRAANHAKAGVIAVGSPVTRLRIRRAIRAAPKRLARAIRRDRPLRHVSAEIENQFLVLVALAREASRLFQERRVSSELFDFVFQSLRVFRIDRVAGPVIERILARAVFVKID